MGNYQLYIIAERQNRIEKNNIKKSSLKEEIEELRSICKKDMEKIMLLKSEYNKVREELNNLEDEYNRLSDDKILYHKSDCIQSLSEAIAKKEKSIRFTDCLRECYNGKENIVLFINAFKKYNKYQKQVTVEEREEDLTFFEVMYEYVKQYLIFRKNKKQISDSPNVIAELLFKYEFEKRDIIDTIEKLNFQLEARKKFIRSFPAKKEELTNKLKELLNEIRFLANSDNFVKYKEKISEYSKLEKENTNYQIQIEKVVNIDEKKYYKEKICA